MSNEDIKYDEKGNIVYNNDSTGTIWWKEYDSNNNVIHYKDSIGEELWGEK